MAHYFHNQKQTDQNHQIQQKTNVLSSSLSQPQIIDKKFDTFNSLSSNELKNQNKQSSQYENYLQSKDQNFNGLNSQKSDSQVKNSVRPLKSVQQNNLMMSYNSQSVSQFSKSLKETQNQKASSQEEYEKLRFQFYEMQEQITNLQELQQNVIKNRPPVGGHVIVTEQVWNTMTLLLGQLSNGLESSNSTLSDLFDNQESAIQQEQKRSKALKRKVWEYQNQSQTFMREHQQFEASMRYFSKRHEQTKSRIGTDLDQMENQVCKLKDTRNALNLRYEKQLDLAVKEMQNFYNNLENKTLNETCLRLPQDKIKDLLEEEELEINITNNLEKAFLIKPTENNVMRIDQKLGSQLSKAISIQESSRNLLKDSRFDNNSRTVNSLLPGNSSQINNTSDYRPFSQNEDSKIKLRTPVVPRVPIERIGVQIKTFDHQVQENNNNNKSSARQQKTSRSTTKQPTQVSQRSQSNKKAQSSKRGQSSIMAIQVAPNQSNLLSSRSPRFEDLAIDLKTASSQRCQSQLQTKREKNLQQNKNEEDEIYLNPVMAGAAHVGSAFEEKYEDDFDGANATLDMNTERLQQFPEEYAMLQNVQDEDQRILLKQQIFFMYEKLLRKQAKQERKRRKKLQQQAQAQRQSNEQIQTKQEDVFLQNSERIEQNEGLGMNSRPSAAVEMSQIVTSRYSLHSQLPPLSTQDMMEAQANYQPKDVNLSEILDFETSSVPGLKTATQASLIHKYGEELRQKELVAQQLKDGEKKMNYSSSIVSRVSLAGKSGYNTGLVQKDNYQSNNSNNNHLIFINDSDSLEDQIKGLNSCKNAKSNYNSFTPDNQAPNSEQKNEKMFLKKQTAQIDQLELDIKLAGGPPEKNFELESLTEEDSSQASISAIGFVPNNESDFVNDSVFLMPSPFFRNQHAEQPENLQLVNNSALDSEQFSQINYQNIQQIAPLSYQAQSDQKNKHQKELEKYKKQKKKSTDAYQSNRNFEKQENSQKNFLNNQQYHEELRQVYKQKAEDQNNQEVINQLQQMPILPLEIIQERQSEFSQSVLTNAMRLNTNRSSQHPNSQHRQPGTGCQTSAHKPQVANTQALQTISSRDNNKNKDYPLKSNNSLDKLNINKLQQKRQNENKSQVAYSPLPFDVINQNISKNEQDQKMLLLKEKRSKDKHHELERKRQKEQLSLPDFKILNTDRGDFQQDQQTLVLMQQLNSYRSHYQSDIQGQIHSNSKYQNPKQSNQPSEFKKVNHFNYDSSNEFIDLAAASYNNFSNNLVHAINQQESGLKGNKGSKDTGQDSAVNNSNQAIKDFISYGSQFPVSMGTSHQTINSAVNQYVDSLNAIHGSKPDTFAKQTPQTQSKRPSKDEKVGQIQIQRSISEQKTDNEKEEKAERTLDKSVVRSNSECLLRDKEFYEMCDLDDEILLYQKLAEQSIVEAIHLRNLADFQQLKQKKGDTSLIPISTDANDSNSLASNKLVLMSQKTFQKMLNRFVQPQPSFLENGDKSEIQVQGLSASQINNKQVQGFDPKKINNFLGISQKTQTIIPQLAHIQNYSRLNQALQSKYLGTNLLLTTLNESKNGYPAYNFMSVGQGSLLNNVNDGQNKGSTLVPGPDTSAGGNSTTLPLQFFNQMMMPTHQYNRQTLLMMQNLHNNFLYNANTGILFTQRGNWNGVLGTGETDPHQLTKERTVSRIAAKISSNSIHNLTQGSRSTMHHQSHLLNKNILARMREQTGSEMKNLNIEAADPLLAVAGQSCSACSLGVAGLLVSSDARHLCSTNLQSVLSIQKPQNIIQQECLNSGKAVQLSGEPVNISNLIQGSRTKTNNQKVIVQPQKIKENSELNDDFLLFVGQGGTARIDEPELQSARNGPPVQQQFEKLKSSSGMSKKTNANQKSQNDQKQSSFNTSKLSKNEKSILEYNQEKNNISRLKLRQSNSVGDKSSAKGSARGSSRLRNMQLIEIKNEQQNTHKRMVKNLVLQEQTKLKNLYDGIKQISQRGQRDGTDALTPQSQAFSNGIGTSKLSYRGQNGSVSVRQEPSRLLQQNKSLQSQNELQLQKQRRFGQQSMPNFITKETSNQTQQNKGQKYLTNINESQSHQLLSTESKKLINNFISEKQKRPEQIQQNDQKIKQNKKLLEQLINEQKKLKALNQERGVPQSLTQLVDKDRLFNSALGFQKQYKLEGQHIDMDSSEQSLGYRKIQGFKVFQKQKQPDDGKIKKIIKIQQNNQKTITLTREQVNRSQLN